MVANTQENSSNVANHLREKGINTELYIDDRPLDKQLRYADKKGIPFVIIPEGDKLTLKNMLTGNKREVTLESLSNELS